MPRYTIEKSLSALQVGAVRNFRGVFYTNVTSALHLAGSGRIS
jgi:hypothetical protein